MFFAIARVSGYDWKAAIQRAQAVAGLKDESVAAILGVTRQRWAQIRDGGGLQFDHVTVLMGDPDGRVFGESLVRAWAADMGVSSLDLAEQWLEMARLEFRRIKTRMAKASLRDDKQERRSA